MKRVLILICLIAFLFSLEAKSCSTCDGSDVDWIDIQILSAGPRPPVGGHLHILITVFTTFEDGCEQDIEYVMERDCWDETPTILSGAFSKSGSCMLICGMDCPNNVACVDCPGVTSHALGYFDQDFPLWGKGTIKLFFKGSPVFEYPFDYGGGGEPELEFIDIRFRNRDGSAIIYNDIFDVYESVAIEVSANFEGEEPPDAVGVVLSSDVKDDTIVVSLPLSEVASQTAIYYGILPAGTFVQLVGDPENTLPPYAEAEIKARPVVLQCEGEEPPEVPEDILPIANFVLWVQEIAFFNDHQLNKNTPTTEIQINDPVWIKDTKNDPVAYTRNTTMNMDMVIHCDRYPKHDFVYWFSGFASDGENMYYVPIIERHMTGCEDIINSIEPQDGPFPDHVALIENLNGYWFANKSYFYNPMNFKSLGNSSHKIYLTYDTPLFNSVNIIAMDKACSYGNGLSDPTEIAKREVDSLYLEAWQYDPGHTIFKDPLDVIRNKVGQCADYANVMTYLYKALGIPANSMIIFNGKTIGSQKKGLFWQYSPDNSWLCLWSEELMSCDSVTQRWLFPYHAASYCQSHICDAALGQFRTLNDYTGYWKYYIHPRPTQFDPPHPSSYYSHDEPPPFEPSYYHWLEFINPAPPPNNTVLPGYGIHYCNFSHP